MKIVWGWHAVRQVQKSIAINMKTENAWKNPVGQIANPLKLMMMEHSNKMCVVRQHLLLHNVPNGTVASVLKLAVYKNGC